MKGRYLFISSLALLYYLAIVPMHIAEWGLSNNIRGFNVDTPLHEVYSVVLAGWYIANVVAALLIVVVVSIIKDTRKKGFG